MANVAKLPVNKFAWRKDTSQFNENFINNYNEESGDWYFLEVDAHYLGRLHERHNDLPFLHERTKIEKVEMLVATLHDKTEYVLHIRNLKQALIHRLVFKKVHKVMKFNQNALLILYLDIYTDLRKKAKNDLKKNFFLGWWITQFFEKLWKMWENIEILNFSQHKEAETICYQNQITILSFSQKTIEMKKS